MTTKPKARRFRIRRAAPLAGSAADPGHHAGAPPRPAARPQPRPAPETTDDGLGDQRFPPAAPAQGEITSAADVAAEAEIDAIRKEGLTGRQLRLARRVAQKHNLPAISDFDAVRLLRQAGIDPFQRASVLDLVSADTAAGGSRALTTLP